MDSSLLTFLAGVVLLGIWHAVLVSRGGEPMWARSVIRGVLLLVTVIQGAAFARVRSLTAEVKMDQLSKTLAEVSWWTGVADISSAVLLGIGFIVLAGFTVRRVIKGPIPPPVA